MNAEIGKIKNIEQMRANLLIMIAAYEAKGFTKCENLVRAGKELAALSYDRYNDKYPDYLFFTDEQFEEIVKRNKLAVSDVGEYTGNIPDECWKIIETENIDREDIRGNEYNFKFNVPGCLSSITSSGNLCTVETFESLKRASAEEIAKWISATPFNGKIKTVNDVLHMLYENEYKGRNETRPISVEIIEEKNNEGLYIACPKKMKGKIANKTVRILDSFQAKPKDPIVFRKVKDGILVITFWR